MANWWDADPVAQGAAPAAGAGKNFWDADPVAGPAPAASQPAKDKMPGVSWWSDMSAAARALGLPKVAAVAESVGQGFSSDQRGLGQIIDRIVPGLGLGAQQKSDAERLAALRQEAGLTGFDAGKLAGSMLTPASVATMGAPVNGAWRYLARPGMIEAAQRGVVQGATLGALAPVENADQQSGGQFLTSKAEQMGLGGAFGAAGNMAGEALATRAAAKAAAEKAAQNPQREQLLRDAASAGYVFPPNMVSENGKGTWLQGLAGKIKTAQAASDKNQVVTDNLVRQALGMPEGAPITRGALADMREVAGQAYKAVAGSGVDIVPDTSFKAAVAQIGVVDDRLASQIPMAASSDILKVRKQLQEFTGMDSSAAVETIKRWRSEANNLTSPTTYKANQQAEARVYQDAADALENLVERNLQAAGKPDLIPALQTARQLIAKTHTVEKAIDAAGNVTAGKLVRDAAKGKSRDELALIGDVASAFPKAMQNPSKLGGTLSNSPLDWFAAGGIGGLGYVAGHPALAAMGAASALARPAARSWILSPSMQKAIMEQGVNRGLLSNPMITPQLTGASMGLLGAGLVP